MVMEGVKKLSGSLGAEILGMNLENDLSESMLTDIKGYLNEHEVIFFRDQDISWDTHKKIADFFGPAQTHPAYESPDGYPEITILESTPEKPTLIEEWHTDMTFKKNPPLCSIFLSRLCAAHDFCHGFQESLAQPGGRERLQEAINNNPPVHHPVVRTHPENGKKAIFVNPLFTTKIVGLNKQESKAILKFLYEYVITPEFTCRFSWGLNSIAIWDNRCTQHKPINDYFPAHRKMERITVDGDIPF